MLSLAVVVWASTVFGRLLVRRISGDALRGAELNLFGAGVGLGTLAYAVLAVGLIGGLRVWVLMVIVAGMLLAGRREHLPMASDIMRAVRGLLKLSALDKWCVLGCIVAVLLMLLGALAPPSGNDWDGLSYHLAAPKLYLQNGRIFFIPYDHHTNFPFTVEMLYTVGLAFAGPGPARAFHTLLGMLCAVGVALLWRRRAGRDMMALPALLFLTAPLVSWCGTVAYNDLGMALYVFLSAYGVVVWMDSGDRRWLMLSGVSGGLALGTKMTALVPVGLLAVWVLAFSVRQPLAERLKAVAALLGSAVIVGAPWYLKSWVWTGNPVYPFFYSVFGGVNWSAEAARMYAQEQAMFGVGRNLLGFLTLPFTLTFRPELFSRGVGVFGSPGPFALAFIPLVVLNRPVDRRLAGVGLFSLAYIVVWFNLTQQSRYLVPVVAFTALLSAWGVRGALRRAVTRTAAVLVLVVQTVMVCGLLFLLVRPGLPVVLGAKSAPEYLQRSLDVYPAQQWINRNTPRSARVLLYDETRGFYLDRAYFWANPGHHTLIPYESFRTPSDMVRWLADRGFTHALVNKRWRSPGWGTSGWSKLFVDAVGQGQLVPVYSDRCVDVYQIRPDR
ncbi:MAG: glycosyltransferase family 39 protein [Armatimonadota bacterium]